MNTDEQIRMNVESLFREDAVIDAAAVDVAVRKGVATVTGRLSSRAQRWAVERAVRRVPGVLALVMELQCEASPEKGRTDVDIAAAASCALQWNGSLAAVRIRVNEGWITLHGEVAWEYQRAMAEMAVCSLTGVRGVHNHLTARHGEIRLPS